jgi:hypothetical protein
MPRSHVVLLNTVEGRELVKKTCRKSGISIAILEDLISAEADQQGKMRKAGLWDDFDQIFDGVSQGER